MTGLLGVGGLTVLVCWVGRTGLLDVGGWLLWGGQTDVTGGASGMGTACGWRGLQVGQEWWGLRDGQGYRGFQGVQEW
ncbi:hypothetical protein CYMTET_26115 [Cymbomonas tetramitiformis]|uniref:Uncharacterized protein n=1 Tax=Cymbomonas tetramitiformis TaxID=36881 RepID=A0AAE0FTA1_9CHLO|nr:hypothetical protein CYMTET_26115 [Cymbomonas tetramitiformis]